MNENKNRLIPSAFNARFTQLVDEKVEGMSLEHKLHIIQKHTGIYHRTLRRYYLAKTDFANIADEVNRVNQRNRQHMASIETIDKLSRYFNVPFEYLAGTRDTKVNTTSVLSALVTDGVHDGNAALEEGLIEARASKYWLSYKTTLSWLLTDLSDNPENMDNPEFLLLYSIGEYLFRPTRPKRVVLPEEIIKQAELLRKRGKQDPDLVAQLLTAITGSYEEMESEDDIDEKYLEKIVEQLKAVRAEVKTSQNLALSVMKAYAEKHGGSITFADGDISPEAREAFSSCDYEYAYREV